LHDNESLQTVEQTRIVLHILKNLRVNQQEFASAYKEAKTLGRYSIFSENVCRSPKKFFHSNFSN